MEWYIRFQTTLARTNESWPLGVFHAYRHVLITEEYQVATATWIEELYAWFNENLIVPPRDQLDPRAVFWFRPSARECVRAGWSLAHAFRVSGIVVHLQRTNCPGRVLYSDQHQIAAIPYWRFGRGPPTGHGRPFCLWHGFLLMSARRISQSKHREARTRQPKHAHTGSLRAQ